MLKKNATLEKSEIIEMGVVLPSAPDPKIIEHCHPIFRDKRKGHIQPIALK